MIQGPGPFQPDTAQALSMEQPAVPSDGDDALQTQPSARPLPLSGIGPLLSADGTGVLIERQARDLGTQLRSAPEISANGRPKLSREEALNLTRPAGSPVDLNGDGYVPSFGGAKVWRFPPPAADPAVHRAWAEATAGLDPPAITDLTDRFTSMNLMLNMDTSSQGEVMVRDPGDPGWRDLFSETGFSYSQAANSLVAANESTKPFALPETYERNRELLGKLSAAFARHGVG